MGEIIYIKDFYEHRADNLLQLMQHSNNPEHKIELAVEYSKLQAKITRLNYLKFQENTRRMFNN